MLQEIIKFNPELIHKEKEVKFLLDQLMFFGLNLRDVETNDLIFVDVELKEDNIGAELVIRCTYLNDDHAFSDIQEHSVMKSLSDVITDILLKGKYYLDVEAKEIDPFNFELNKKEKQFYLQEYYSLKHDYLVKIKPASSKLKYENNTLFFYNDLLHEYRSVPDCFLYELHLLIQKEAA